MAEIFGDVIIALKLQPENEEEETKLWENEILRNLEWRRNVAVRWIHEVLGVARNGGEELVNLKHLRLYHPLVPLTRRRTRRRRRRRRIRLFLALFTHGINQKLRNAKFFVLRFSLGLQARNRLLLGYYYLHFQFLTYAPLQLFFFLKLPSPETVFQN